MKTFLDNVKKFCCELFLPFSTGRLPECHPSVFQDKVWIFDSSSTKIGLTITMSAPMRMMQRVAGNLFLLEIIPFKVTPFAKIENIRF